MAVHSLKDLPTAMTPGLELACTPPRATPFDVLVSRDGALLHDLPEGTRVGTASIRRRIQLHAVRPDLQIVAIRGNVDSRLKRIDTRELDAVVLAAAGLERLGLAERITELLGHQIFPSCSSGCLVIQTNQTNKRIREIIKPIHDIETYLATISGERFWRLSPGLPCSKKLGQIWSKRRSSLGGCVLSDAVESGAAHSVERVSGS